MPTHCAASSSSRRTAPARAGYIFREAKRVETLSRSLLALMGLGEQELVFEPVPLARIFRSVGVSLAPVLQGVELRFQNPGRMRVLADETLVHDLLYNLIHNAVKAQPKDNTVRVRLARSADAVNITVEDTGRGIPKESLHRITEPFYMVDKSPRAQGGRQRHGPCAVPPHCGVSRDRPHLRERGGRRHARDILAAHCKGGNAMKKRDAVLALGALCLTAALCAVPAGVFAVTDSALFSGAFTQNARRGSLDVTGDDVYLARVLREPGEWIYVESDANPDLYSQTMIEKLDELMQAGVFDQDTCGLFQEIIYRAWGTETLRCSIDTSDLTGYSGFDDWGSLHMQVENMTERS